MSNPSFSLAAQGGNIYPNNFTGSWNPNIAPTGLLGAVSPGAAILAGQAVGQPGVAAGDGVIVPVFGDDFFENIHIRRERTITGSETAEDLVSDWQRTFDFGNILQEQSTEFELFNAWRDTAQTVFSAVPVPPEGLTLVSDDPLPDLLGANLSLGFTLVVELEGPPAINADLIWDTSDTDPIITLTGSRVVLFGFIPQRQVREELAFATDIMIARDGTEQRVALKTTPNTLWNYTYRLEEPERSAAMNLMIGSGDRVFTVPTWFEASELEQDVSIGQLVIPVDTRFADYRDDGQSLALFWRAWNDFEAVPILTRSDFSITLARPTENAHSAIDTLIMPARSAVLSSESGIQRYPRNVADTNIRWRILGSTDRNRMATASPPPTYRGLPVIDDANYITSGVLTESVDQDSELIASDGGAFELFTPREYPIVGSQKTWKGFSREDRWNLRGLLHQLNGRQKAFYLPTFAQDFIPVQPLTNGTSTLQYDPNGYADEIGQVGPRQDIQVRLKDGTIYFRQIIASVDDEVATAFLTLDTTWPIDVAIDEIDRVSLMSKVRLNTDRFTLSYTDTVETTVTSPTVEVEN